MLKSFAVVSVLALLAILAIALGILDRFSGDGKVGVAAIASITTYWGVLAATVGLFQLGRRRPRELTLALVSVVMVAVFAEVALRVVAPNRALRPFGGRSSRTFHHIYPTNVKMYMGNYEGNDVVVRTNDDGLRSSWSREAYLQKPHRIALLGDSFTMGFGVRQEYMVAQVLEDTLRYQLRQDDIAVLNAGVVSHSPILSKQMYQELVREYEPTVVMLILDCSDIGDDIHYAREASVVDGKVVFDVPETSGRRGYSAVLQVLGPVWSRVKQNLEYPYYTLFHSGTFNYDYYDFEVTVAGKTERNRFFIYRHPLDDTRPFFNKTLGYVRDIKRMVEADGGTFILVVAPRYHHWNDDEAPDNWEVKQYKYGVNDPYEMEYVRYFREVESAGEFDVLNLLYPFIGAKQAPLVFRADPHWNEAGHRFVAARLAEYLVTYDLIR